MSERALVVIPTYIRTQDDVDTTLAAVKSVRDTQHRIDILLVDDGSPEELLVDNMAEMAIVTYGAEVHRKDENSGFSKTVNVGLQRALDEGRDAILMNADVEVTTKHWLPLWRSTLDDKGRPCAVGGALLMFPDGLIQHGGIYFSMLTRSFDHIFKYAPMDLPDAHKKRNCPVTGAFQFIRHETLTVVGLYDETFSMGWEDVDYCLRVFDAGLRCVFNPDIRGWHHEMKFRGRPSPKVAEWQAKSWMRLRTKWAHADLSEIARYG